MKLQESLRSLLAAPPAADEDRSRSAQTINTLCLVLLVGLLPIVAHNGFSRNWTMAATVGTAWAGMFLPLALARRGRSEIAGLAFAALMVSFLAAVVVLSPLGVFDVAIALSRG